MEEDNRNTKKPVPDDLTSILNEEQLIAYRGLERFGWYIKFVRRPLFQRPVCVMSNPEGTILAVLEKDGSLNENPDVPLRK